MTRANIFLTLINPYPRNYSYAGITLEYNGANSAIERVSTSNAIRLQQALNVEVNDHNFHDTINLTLNNQTFFTSYFRETRMLVRKYC